MYFAWRVQRKTFWKTLPVCLKVERDSDEKDNQRRCISFTLCIALDCKALLGFRKCAAIRCGGGGPIGEYRLFAVTLIAVTRRYVSSSKLTWLKLRRYGLQGFTGNKLGVGTFLQRKLNFKCLELSELGLHPPQWSSLNCIFGCTVQRHAVDLTT